MRSVPGDPNFRGITAEYEYGRTRTPSEVDRPLRTVHGYELRGVCRESGASRGMERLESAADQGRKDGDEAEKDRAGLAAVRRCVLEFEQVENGEALERAATRDGVMTSLIARPKARLRARPFFDALLAVTAPVVRRRDGVNDAALGDSVDEPYPALRHEGRGGWGERERRSARRERQRA